MSVIRTAQSNLGKFLAPQINAFIKANAVAASENGTIDDGTEALAEAISYGIAKALGSPIFITALAAGIGPTGAGAQIAASLTPNVLPDQV